MFPSPGRANDRYRPTITVAKTANRATAAPGEFVTYSLFYNNTDAGMARTVWVNDTLPLGVVYSSSSVPYNSVSGSAYRWVFTNVMPGAHSFTVTAQVTSTTADGQVLGNTVTLDYRGVLAGGITFNLHGSGGADTMRAFLDLYAGSRPLIGHICRAHIACPEAVY